jgi:hypothetical protein
MNDNSKPDNTAKITQYQQVCEDLRQLDNIVWQIIPPLVAVIGGTLIVVVFSVLAEAILPARELVLGIGLLLMVGMSFVLLRIRYFEAIAVGSLSKLEKDMEIEHIQRIPFPKELDERHPESKMYPRGLLYEATPGSVFKDGTPGPKLMFWFMMIMVLGTMSLMPYIIIQTGNENPTCVEKSFAWVIFAVFFGAAFCLPVVLKRQENKRIKKEEERKNRFNVTKGKKSIK